MTTVNFISKTETQYHTRGNEIISSNINSQYGKITSINYGFSQSKIESFDRKCKIILRLFTVLRVSEDASLMYEFDDRYNNSRYATHQCYAEREFEFETMVPTGHAHILNFRYQDLAGYQYYTAVDKNSNKIYEAGFIDKGLISRTPGMVIDAVDTKFDQFQFFLQSNI